MTDMTPGSDEYWMSLALEQAGKACEYQEVPVGAVIVQQGNVVGAGFNKPVMSRDASAHAEIDAIRIAGFNTGNYRLPGATVYVTLEPCVMCVGALIHARVERVIFGAREPKAGALESQLTLLSHTHWNHRFSWRGGVLADECSALLSRFFQERREEKRRLKTG